MEWSSWSLIVAILVLITHYVWKKLNSGYDHFEKRGVPFIKPSLLFGSTAPILQRKVTTQQFIIDVFNEFPDASIIGLFDQKRPTYMIKDPEIIKQMIVKDFEHFMDHQQIVDGKSDPYFGSNLFNLQGQKWRDMRTTLSPIFTGRKMKQMFDLIPEIAEQMSEYFKNASAADRIVEMKDIFGRFGLDSIASTSFGVKIDSLKDKDNKFYRQALQLMDLNSLSTHIRFMVLMYTKWLGNFLKLRIITASKSAFFEKLMADTEREREQQGIERADLVQLLMQIKKGQLAEPEECVSQDDSAGFATVQEAYLGKTTTTQKWTNEELLAQAFAFFLGGFDTSSSASAFIAYELAINPEIQDKLVEEVDMVTEELQGKILTYEVLQKMKYMDMVVSEGLRYWSAVDITERTCTKDYKLKNDQGEEFIIEKNSSIWLPVIAFHFSQKYFENPNKFDPERFNDENKHKINNGTYLPFGIGPRNCIGSRYGLMQVKAGLYYILRDFTFEKTEKTQVPLLIKKALFMKVAENGIWLKLEPRKGSQ